MLKPISRWLFWHNPTRWITIYPNIYYPRFISDPTDFPEIIAHENTHLLQQKQYGCGKWIIKYLFNRSFRLMSEAEAIAVELSLTSNLEYRNTKLEEYSNLLAESAYLWAARDKIEAKTAIVEHLNKIDIQF